jgi:drug/metabolite transporter (DMT)-like permease
MLFALLGVTWGIPYLLIKIAVRQLDPAMLVLARTALAAAVLLPLAAVRGEIMPVLRRWAAASSPPAPLSSAVAVT